ncbi:SDR family NAD(P)-dependent oxidoreductase [Jeotgalibacillus soli]|uniref:3-oxoacyl-[acyl-carrier-protein] reductase n=1 Tax=Jeotgalibacillus soli TaxID=889306 RepID=A0A0C2RIE7_9BACL|nr:glucose 1-dehydrogenase [Jeotgalibacillus soli]KIL49935.1 3-oxoacyl-[acyl-carrier-protein] reductase [Jeotgalibacillus soli]
MLVGNRVILVTGAARGIGQATAVFLAASGAQVIIHGRSEESMDETVRLIQSAEGLEPLRVAYDVRDEAGMKLAFKQIKKIFGRLDGLVNNAGIMTEGLMGMVKTTHIQEMLDVNVTSVILHMQLSSRLMLKNKQGSIVNVSSIIGTRGSEGSAAYAASKAAVIGATLSASKEWAGKGVRVNAVAPGFIETDLTAHYMENKKEKLLETIKMNRFGHVEEVASVISFLLSDMSSYITGQVIGVDGGMVI